MIENLQEKVILLDNLQQPNSSNLNLETQLANTNTITKTESQKDLLDFNDSLVILSNPNESEVLNQAYNQSEQEYLDGNTSNSIDDGDENSTINVLNDDPIDDNKDSNSENVLFSDATLEDFNQSLEGNYKDLEYNDTILLEGQVEYLNFEHGKREVLQGNNELAAELLQQNETDIASTLSNQHVDL